MISNIVIDNPVTRQRESLTQAQFNSYMAQTNGAVLKWIIEPVAKHGTHDQSTHGSWATGVGKNWTTRTEKDRTIFSQDRGPKLLEVSIANKNLANPKNKKDFEDALSTIDILNDAFPIAGSVHFGVSELGGNGRIASTWSTVMEFGVTSPAQIAQISVGHEWFNVPKDMQTHILTHEWGHANDFRPSEVAKSQANNFSEALFQDSEIPMTEYGLSSDREAYAEAFAIKFNNSHKGGIYSSDVQQTDKWEEVFKIFELDTVNKALGKRVSFKVWDTFDANNPPKLIEDYDPLVLKHGTHDQKTHGSWATGSVPTSITTSTNAIGQETQTITYGDIVIQRDKPGEVRSIEDNTRLNWTFRDGGDAMRFVSSRIMGIENASGIPKMIEGERDALIEGKKSPWKKVPEWISGAYTLMEDVHTAQKMPDVLHRGIRVDTNSSILNIKEGQVLELPLSATSTARKTADMYGGYAGSWEMPVFFTIAKGAKATPIRFSTLLDGSLVGEYVTQGKFKVVSVDKSSVVMENAWSSGMQSRASGAIEVVLEHTDTYSVDKGGYESIKP